MDMSEEPFCALRGPRFGWKLKHMLQEPLCMEIYRKSAVPEFQDPHFVWKFTGKNAHGHVRRAILCGNLQEKRHRHRSQEPFCGFRGPRFGLKLRHMLQQPFCVEIYRKSAGHPFQDRDFVWKFTGKMRGTPVPTWTYTGPFLLLP